MALRSYWLAGVAVCAACGSSGGGGGGGGAGSIDAPNRSGHDDAGGSGGGNDSGSGNAGSDASTQIMSSLTSACATLQGRAIVNYNDNLGIAFTEQDSPYTFLGSVQFQLPDGFTGAVPDPEIYDGSDDRHIAAMTDAGFDLHGNHCWDGAQPPPGTLVIDEYDPTDGIVKATFDNYAMHSCTDSSVCTVSGSIETTGQGVFD